MVAIAPAAIPVGTPSCFVYGDQLHVFYRAADSHVSHVYRDGSGQLHADRWTTLLNTPLAAGDPATMVTEQQQHLFYRGNDGHINHTWWTGWTNRLDSDQWTANTGVPLAAGDPATLVVGSGSEQRQHLFYRGADGQINHISYPGFRCDQWTSLAGAPLAAGDPATMVVGAEPHIFYRGHDGHINHIWWDGSFHKDQWTSVVTDNRTAFAGVRLAAGDPMVAVTGSVRHVYYRDANGALVHIFRDEARGSLELDFGWSLRLRLELVREQALAAGDPAAFALASGSYADEGVCYRATDDSIVVAMLVQESSPYRPQWWWRRLTPVGWGRGDPTLMVVGTDHHLFYPGPFLNHLSWGMGNPGQPAFEVWSNILQWR